MRLLAILRDRRLSLQLLWRHGEFLPARDGNVAVDLDRNLLQPGRRE